MTVGEHVLSSVSIAKNGQAEGIRSNVKQPGQLVAFSMAKPADMRVRVDVNADVLTGATLAGA